MRFFFKLACFTLMPLLCHVVHAQAPEAVSSVNFPVIVSYNLDKAKVTLPRDLKGEMNLLLLPFEREQQKDADSWLPVAKEIEASRPGFRHYMLPVFAKENFLYRWWMNSSLRSDLPADQQRQFTIPLYINRKSFLQPLQIASDHEITVLLVEKNGRVIWRVTGALTEAKRASLESILVGSAGSGR
jgi:hypothetical protein